jgi:hypothetical protein
MIEQLRYFTVGLCLPLAATAVFGADQWKAGAAAISITPDLPGWMSGYGARTKPADKVAQPLYAKALALEDAAGKTVVIVTTDLLGIPRILREAVDAEVASRYRLARENLLINASHTHSGPELRGVKTFLNDLDRARSERVAAYQAKVKDRLVAVIGEALQRRAPATVAYGQARAGFAMNRRKNYNLKPGEFGADKVPNPLGPVDHDVPVLQVKDAGGKMIALLFGYACHNTTSGDYAFHGDYAGFAQATLEETYPGTVALFMLGCGGDQNPYPRGPMVPGKSALDLAKRHGEGLASAVDAAINAFPRPLSGRIASVMETVALPYLPAPTREQLEERKRSKKQPDRDYAEVLLEILNRDGKLPASYAFPVQVMHLGPELTLVGLASEMVVDYSLRLKKEIKTRSVWVAAYCNDFMGYIPSRRIWEEGGYEGGGALTYMRETQYRIVHPNIWDPSVEELIVGKVHQLHEKMSRSGSASAASSR